MRPMLQYVAKRDGEKDRVIPTFYKGNTMADSESILQLGIEAARAGDKAEARELFRLVTREDPHNQQGWLWLAGVAEDREEKRAALQHVIEIDPTNELARKGLAALGYGHVPASPETPPPMATEAPIPAETPTAPSAPPRPLSDTAPLPTTPSEQTSRTTAAIFGTADSLAASDVAGTSPTGRLGARTYDSSGPLSTLTDDAVASSVDTDQDDYDLEDYQQLPPSSGRDDAYQTVAPDTQPRRRSALPWLPILLGLAVIVALFLIYNTFIANPQTATNRPGATETTAALGGENIAPGSTEQSTTQTAVAGAQTTAEGTIEGTPAPTGEGTGAPQESQTVVVVVPPDATGATEAGTAPPQTTQAPPPPANSSDVASANPAIVPNDTSIQAGQWTFTYSGIKNVTDSIGGVAPSHGQFQIVLVAVANNSDQAASIPDGLLVLKDAQGHVYDFNRAVSIDYFQRAGGAGQAADVDANAQIPSNDALTSMPLLFDVPPDATNLVLLSRNNLNQGFMIR